MFFLTALAGQVPFRASESTSNLSSSIFVREDRRVSSLPPNVSMRELLEQAVSQMTSTTSYDSRLKVEPWDYSIMEPLTQTNQPNPFLLIVGEEYLDEVQRHAYYYGLAPIRWTPS